MERIRKLDTKVLKQENVLLVVADAIRRGELHRGRESRREMMVEPTLNGVREEFTDIGFVLRVSDDVRGWVNGLEDERRRRRPGVVRSDLKSVDEAVVGPE